MIDLWHGWPSDVKAHRWKAAVLAGLFLFGCCLWVPMLAKAVTQRGVSEAASDNMGSIHAPVVVTEQQLSSAGSDEFWSGLSNSLANDPLFQVAEIGDLDRDPFGLTEDEEPLPVLFADEAISKPNAVLPVIEEAAPSIVVNPVVEVTVPVVEVRVAATSAESGQLQLTSTIISRSRRAAMINGKFISVGREIQANGKSYRLSQVESHRVLLIQGDETVELKIARSQLKDVLDPRVSGDPRE